MSSRPFRAEDYAVPAVLGMAPYTPGEQINEEGWTKLNTNENPFPPSPAATDAAAAALEQLPLYPEPTSAELRAVAASRAGLSPDHAIAGNGSDDLLNLLVRTFSGADRSAGALDPSYSLYPVLAAANGSAWRDIPFREAFRLPVEDILASDCQLFFLTRPHAPSGVAFPLSEVAALAESIEGILVVDEAYGDFAAEPALPLLREHPNLVVTRSLSKSAGLAGLRIGYALADPGIIALLDRIRDSYNLDRVAQAAGAAALRDEGYLDAIVGKIAYIRDFYAGEFAGLGWQVFPSQANFLFVEPRRADGTTGPEVAADLFAHLRAHRILVRRFPKHPLTRSCLRISVGDEEQMLRLWNTIRQWQENE